LRVLKLIHNLCNFSHTDIYLYLKILLYDENMFLLF